MIYNHFPDQEKYEKSMLFFVREGFQLTKEGLLLQPKLKEVMRYLRKADFVVEQSLSLTNAKVNSKQIKKNHEKIMEKRYGNGEVNVFYKLIWEEEHILRNNFNRKGILNQELPDSVTAPTSGEKMFPVHVPSDEHIQGNNTPSHRTTATGDTTKRQISKKLQIRETEKSGVIDLTDE